MGSEAERVGQVQNTFKTGRTDNLETQKEQIKVAYDPEKEFKDIKELKARDEEKEIKGKIPQQVHNEIAKDERPIPVKAVKGADFDCAKSRKAINRDYCSDDEFNGNVFHYVCLKGDKKG